MKIKRLISALTATAMLGLLAACSSNSTSSGSASEDQGGANSNAEASENTNTEGLGDFPSETITLVCPFSAGGGTDIGARNMASALSKELGVNVVVENQTGSGGWIAWTDLITGDYSDGYRIGLINHNYAMGELDPENPREYNLDDVQLLANQAIDYNVMAIRSDDDRFTDLDSFIDYAKENPVLISAQATGITDGDATTAEWFNQTFDTQITVVPVDGASDSRSMFLAKDTDVLFASVSDVMSAYESGEMKIVCVFAEERSEFMSDVPTIKEATGEEFYAFAARGYFYPNNVSPEIAAYMTEAITKVMEDAEYIENMSSLGLKLDNTSGDAYYELLSSQVEQRKEIWNVQ